MTPLNYEHVGELIEDGPARESWCSFVQALEEATQEGRALEGWVFHGTGGKALSNIRRHGLKRFPAMVSTVPGTWDNDARGVHFGSPAIAAFFAEDKIESTGRQDVEMSIFGVHLRRLALCGDLAADGQMVDCPIPTRLAVGDNAHDHWDQSARDWRASLSILGSVVVLGAVPADFLVEIKNREDLDQLIGRRRAVRP